MVPLSVLDLAPVVEGGSVSGALANARALAQHAERLGYRRYWLAEHHNMPGIASAATSVVIAHVGAATSTIRIGAGGIMLPNHAPLVIAEQFGTLDALFPGRIDLGLGRAPGTDPNTMRALRRALAGSVDTFPNDVVELMNYFEDEGSAGAVHAVPGGGADVAIWILGSSLYGAKLAAALGRPYAFASHFAPAQLDEALEVYRSRFRPSDVLEEPYVMLGVNVVCADSAGEAELLSTSVMQSFVRLRRGMPGRLPPPVRDFEQSLGEMDRALLSSILSCTFVGTAADVRRELEEFQVRTGADELMVVSHIFDHEKRLRSYELLANG